jgi:hypothetical protein
MNGTSPRKRLMVGFLSNSVATSGSSTAVVAEKEFIISERVACVPCCQGMACPQPSSREDSP